LFNLQLFRVAELTAAGAGGEEGATNEFIL